MSHQIHLRTATESDVPCIEAWARAMDADQFMSRHLPERDRVVLWKIIIVDGVEAGAAWLESKPGSDDAVFLGIFLGQSALLGQGIGRAVIGSMIAEVCAAAGDVPIRLNVRSSNTRAIACYKASGFIQIASGEKVGRDGVLIPTITMEFSSAAVL